MYSFSIGKPVTTDKTTYVSCQSKSSKNHRYNFLSRSSVLLTVTVKPLFMEYFGSVVFWYRSPRNHHYFLWEISAQWFFGFAHRETTDTIWSKIWDWFFSLELSRRPRPFCDFKRYKNIFLLQYNMMQ